MKKILSAAKLGQVCYSDTHCRLWDSDTHCDFLIRDLFGWCQCTAPMQREGEICRRDNLVQQQSPVRPMITEQHNELSQQRKPPKEEEDSSK